MSKFPSIGPIELLNRPKYRLRRIYFPASIAFFPFQVCAAPPFQTDVVAVMDITHAPLRNLIGVSCIVSPSHPKGVNVSYNRAVSVVQQTPTSTLLIGYANAHGHINGPSVSMQLDDVCTISWTGDTLIGPGGLARVQGMWEYTYDAAWTANAPFPNSLLLNPSLSVNNVSVLYRKSPSAQGAKTQTIYELRAPQTSTMPSPYETDYIYIVPSTYPQTIPATFSPSSLP